MMALFDNGLGSELAIFHRNLLPQLNSQYCKPLTEMNTQSMKPSAFFRDLVLKKVIGIENSKLSPVDIGCV